MSCESSRFILSSYVTLQQGEKRDIQIITPDGLAPKKPCAHVEVGSTGKGTVQVLEGVICSGGLKLIPRSKDRNSVLPSGLEFKLNPTVVDAGTEIIGANLAPPGFTPPMAVVFKRGVSTLVRVESIENGNRISILLDWSEH